MKADLNAAAFFADVRVEAARFVGHIARSDPDIAEPIEVMLEAALELVTQPHVGQVACSRPLLHAVGRARVPLPALAVL